MALLALMLPEIVRVEAYSGYRADERPIRFLLGDAVHEIAEVEAQWCSPDARHFRVRTASGGRYTLRQDSAAGVWSLE